MLGKTLPSRDGSYLLNSASVCMALKGSSLGPAIKTLRVYLGDDMHILKFKEHC